MGHYVPHTDDEIASMLEFVGVSSIDELFSSIPEALRLAAGDDGRHLDLPDGLSEFDTLAEMERLGDRNSMLTCFAGAGAYDHDIASATKRLAFRTEFVTAYTPYQPEVSQGVLQALFEYQTLLTRLTGVEIANASLYDGATACVEAVNLAVAATGRSTVWVSRGVHPNWRDTMTTFAAGTGHALLDVPLVDGVTQWPSDGEPGALLLQYPNFLGCLDDIAEAARLAKEKGALLLVAFDPVAAGILKTPGSYGADVVVGEGQPSARPSASGARTSDCSRAAPSTCAACPAASSARPSTSRAGAPTSPRCGLGSRTSAARRRRRTSARTRR